MKHHRIKCVKCGYPVAVMNHIRTNHGLVGVKVCIKCGCEEHVPFEQLMKEKYGVKE